MLDFSNTNHFRKQHVVEMFRDEILPKLEWYQVVAIEATKAYVAAPKLTLLQVRELIDLSTVELDEEDLRNIDIIINTVFKRQTLSNTVVLSKWHFPHKGSTLTDLQAIFGNSVRYDEKFQAISFPLVGNQPRIILGNVVQNVRRYVQLCASDGILLDRYLWLAKEELNDLRNRDPNAERKLEACARNLDKAYSELGSYLRQTAAQA